MASNMTIQMQRFVASTTSMLQMLRSACEKKQQSGQLVRDKDIRSAVRFMGSSDQFIQSIKDQSNEFDYSRFIKKAFATLRGEVSLEYLVAKDPRLFAQRDQDRKIITILPGIDIGFGYNCLDHLAEPTAEPHADAEPEAKPEAKPEPEAKPDKSDTAMFWQYMYLFSSSIFNMIQLTNEQKFAKYVHVRQTLEQIEKDMAKTGIWFDNKMFNPFVGLSQSDQTDYGVEQMFTGGELPRQQTMDMGSILGSLGIDKMFDEEKLNEELKGLGEQQIDEATTRIAELLGATDNPEVKEVCGVLINDIVAGFKENGISNMSETIRRVAENAKNNIEVSKMKKTADSMKHFMSNSEDMLKNMKDDQGNPIGDKLLGAIGGNGTGMPNMMDLMKMMSGMKK